MTLFLLGSALIFYRIPIAQYLVEYVAQQTRIPNFKIKVTNVSYDTFALEDLTAGDAAEFSLESLQLNFDLFDLWRGGVLKVNIDRLKLSLDVTGKRPLLGSLDILFSDGEGAEPTVLSVLPFRPELHLTNSEVNIKGEQGLIYLPLAAEIIGTSEDDVQGWLSFEGGKLGDREPEEFYLGAIFSSSDLQLDWDVNWRELGFEGEGAASLFLDGPGLSWNVFGGIKGSVPAVFLGDHAADVKMLEGEVKLDGVGEINIVDKSPKKWRTAIGPLLENLNRSTADLSLEIQTRALLHSGVSLESNLPLRIKQAGLDTHLGFNRDVRYEISGLQGDQSLPSELGDLLGNGVSGQFFKDQSELSLQLSAGRPYSLKLNGKAKGQEGIDLSYQGDVSGEVGLGENLLNGLQGNFELTASEITMSGVKADKAQLQLNTIHNGSNGWVGKWQGEVKGARVEQKNNGTINVLKVSSGLLDGAYQLDSNSLMVEARKGNALLSSLSLPGQMEISSAVSLLVQKFNTTLLLPSPTVEAASLKKIDTKITVKDLSAQLGKANKRISLAAIELELNGNDKAGWRMKSTIGEALIPDVKIRMENFSSIITTPFTPQGTPDDFGEMPFEVTVSGHLKSEDHDLALPAGKFSANGKGTLQELKLQAEFSLLKGATLLSIGGQLDPEDLNGTFDVVIPKILFLEGGVQPATFSPLLSDVKVQNGTFSGHAEVILAKGVPDGHGYINVDINDAVISDLPVKDLAGRFFFQGITEPALPPGQSLKIGNLDAGVPITDIELLFGAFLEKGEPVIELRTAGVNITGGLISLKPDKFFVLEEDQSIEVLVDKLDVKELFALIGREDLSGTGMLSGQVPIRIVGDQVIIKGGHLATGGPGILQIRSQVIADALASGGEQVELLVKALQNFSYTELTLDIEKPINGAAQVKLGISGANKDVLDGHPFRLNINLETRVEPLLEVFLQGQKISQGLVSGFIKKR
ncbi:YdbH domain-containing protein [Kiloniella antarctica]|uniref:YdbH domain-containing protein n=1 Tax=Kiloniella antarctica TaxID=1550907 RepID=A0ABW5BI79_9PROT